MRLFVLARHGLSVFNVDGIVNGDPALDAGLSAKGVEQARDLGRRLSGLAIDLAVVSPFPRTVATADLALDGREVPRVIDEELGDVRVGDLEGGTVDDFRAADAHDDFSVAFPGGESLNDTARRYAAVFERVLARDERVTLVVTHAFAVRYALNAAAGSETLKHPARAIANASPYVFDEAGLRRATARIRELTAKRP